MADGPLSASVTTELERLRIEAGNAAAHWTRSMMWKQRADRAEATLALLATDAFRYSLHDWIAQAPQRSRTDTVTDLLWEIRLRLGLDREDRDPGSEPAPPPPTPTFNHTREDSPLLPCPGCAALMSPADLAAAYRAALEGLLEMVQDDDPTHRCRPDSIAPCCFAQRLLKNTAQRDVQAVQAVQVERQAAGGAGPAAAAAGVPAGPEPQPLKGTRWLYEAHPGSGHQPEDVFVIAVDRGWVRMAIVGTGSQIECSKTSWVKRVKPYQEPGEAGPEPHLPAGGQVGRAP